MLQDFRQSSFGCPTKTTWPRVFLGVSAWLPRWP